MVKKTARTVSYLLFLILAIYGLFPFWITYFINFNLPPNVVVFDFDSDYPGLSQISVQKLSLAIDGQPILLEDLYLNYDLSYIRLAKLTFRLTPQNKQPSVSFQSPFQINKLQLPAFKTQDFVAIRKIKYLQIEQLQIIDHNNTHQLKQITLKSQQENSKKPTPKEQQETNWLLNFSFQPSDQKAASELELQLNITSNHQLTLQAKEKEKEKDNSLFYLWYETNDQNTRLKLTANLTRLLNLVKQMRVPEIIPNGIFEHRIRVKNNLNIDWLQNEINKDIQLTLDAVILLSAGQFNVAQQTITLPKDLELPIQLTLESKTEPEDIVKVKLNGELLDLVFLDKSKTESELKQLNFDLKSQLVFFEKEILFKTNEFNLLAESIEVRTEKKDRLTTGKAIIKLKQDKIRLDFNDRESIDWNIKGLFNATNITADHLKTYSAKEENSRKTSLTSNLNLSFELFKSNQWLSNGQLELSNLQFSDVDFLIGGRLAIDWKELSSNFSQGNISVDFKSENNQIANFDFDDLSMQSDLFYVDKKWKGKGIIFINQQMLAPFSFHFLPSFSDWSIDVKKEQLVNPLFNHFLAIIGERNKIPLKITDGKVIHSAKIKLKKSNKPKKNAAQDKNLIFNSQFSVSDMSIKFGENEVQGMNLTQQITAIDPLQLATSININKINFSSGIAIDNISATMTSDSNEKLVIHDLVGQVLEGQLIANQLTLDPDGLHRSTLQLKEISLTELIFFIGLDGLFAKGKLNLSLPVEFEAGGISLKNGTFEAVGEGVIKYSTGDPSQAAENNIALQALQNFHFKSMSGKLSYTVEGEYHIKLNLLGANPDLYNGYPIDFMLHLQGKLSGVFRSLFLTGDFNEAVMQQVKTDQLNQTESTE